jgi:hypothetical protein
MSNIDQRVGNAECQIDRVTCITVTGIDIGGIMPSVARTFAADHPLYSEAELIEQRRNILRFARSFPPGPERNQHRQIARSLRALFKRREWLEAHVLKDL